MAVEQAIYDVVVASTNSDATGLTYAATITTDNSTVYVRSETYTEPTTVDFTNNQMEIYFQPNVIVSKGLTLSGDNIALILGPGCDIQGTLTLSGDNCSVRANNGCTIQGLTMSGDRGFFDGGGWGTVISGGTSISGIDCIITRTEHSVTSGAAAIQDQAGASTPKRTRFINLQITSATSDDAFQIDATADEPLITGCSITGAGAHGVSNNGLRAIVGANFIRDVTTDGINSGSTGDDSVYYGNIIQDQGGDPIEITTNSEDCVAVANRTDGSITDNSGTSTVANNDETAF